MQTADPHEMLETNLTCLVYCDLVMNMFLQMLVLSSSTPCRASKHIITLLFNTAVLVAMHTACVQDITGMLHYTLQPCHPRY